ncbi:MAG: pantetheine-phosphate adenylyltransferase [Planctomycetota bacterium]|nr:pantetheine-phosphate adenylyltransferase [Planctomycetota bacterium]MDA1105898.1 pantetheine-phosphate adenylyltransferase [Planctomycetota bacterium]
MAHLALYAGSFDPPTLGHLDVLSRSRGLFDEIVVAVGRNPDKPSMFTAEERVAMLRELIDQGAVRAGGSTLRVDAYDQLTVDYAKSIGACAMIRGIRNVTDLAAECQLAITNRQVAGIETIFIVTGEQYAFTSSSLIRQIAAFGGSMDKLAPFVPLMVAKRVEAKVRAAVTNGGAAGAAISADAARAASSAED